MNKTLGLTSNCPSSSFRIKMDWHEGYMLILHLEMKHMLNWFGWQELRVITFHPHF